MVFQSTPPVKAATLKPMPLLCDGNISIHAAREGGDNCSLQERDMPYISIHAAREGGDNSYNLHDVAWFNFNPRRP